MSTIVDCESLGLSAWRCDMSGMTAEQAAHTFHRWGLRLAEHLGIAGPCLYRPHTRDDCGAFWGVGWEDFPFTQWAMTGGAMTGGPDQGWESMRSGAHYPDPELGPFFRVGVDALWYPDTYWGCDIVFVEHDPTWLAFKRSGLSHDEYVRRLDGGAV